MSLEKIAKKLKQSFRAIQQGNNSNLYSIISVLRPEKPKWWLFPVCSREKFEKQKTRLAGQIFLIRKHGEKLEKI